MLNLDYFQETFHFSQLEKLLDIDSEFVALLKLEVRPYNNRDTIEEYRMVLYRLVFSYTDPTEMKSFIRDIICFMNNSEDQK